MLTADVLLGAGEMPAWNGAMGWIEEQLPAGDRALSVCALPVASVLGGVQSLERTFEAAGVEEPGTTPDPTEPASYGLNAVALFASRAEASAAVAAWEAAVRNCAPGSASATDPDSLQIGDLPIGSTWTASAPDPSQDCPECLRFAFIGVAAEGAAVTIVGFELVGQDANYEGDPLAESMAASLARLP